MMGQHWFLWWLGQHLLSTTLLAGVVLVVCRLFRISPAARHVLWLLVLGRLFVPSMATWPWAIPAGFLQVVAESPQANTEPLSASETTEINGQQPPIVAWDLTPTGEFEQPEHSSFNASATLSNAGHSRHASRRFSWELFVIGLWSLGSVIVAAVLIRRVLQVRRLLNPARSADVWLQQDVAALSRRLRVRAPDCVVSERFHSPFLWCLGRIRLVWPLSLTYQERRDQSRPILVHELAHLKRRDHWTAWLELAALVIWWWNPLFWLVRRQLRTASEMACDAWVVELLPEQRRAYAESLLEFSSRTRLTRLAIGAVGADTGSRRAFKQRLEMIMNEQIPARYSKWTLLLATLLGLISLPALSVESEALSTGATPSAAAQADEETVGDSYTSPIAQATASDAENNEQPERAVSLDEVLEQIAENYYGEVDRADLERAAIEAILSNLDANSQLLSPEEQNETKLNVEGELVGVGIAFHMDSESKLPVVDRTLRNSPARAAGIHVGDVILSIDDEPTEGVDLKELVARLRGPRGTSLTLRVHRVQERLGLINGGEATFNVEIIRENLAISRIEPWTVSVTGDEDYWIDHVKKFGYVHVPAFTKQTTSQLRQVLADLSRDGAEGLVFDLRNCPGGLLTAATEVADLFIEEGIIVTSRGRDESDTTVRATRDGTFGNIHVAVMINGYTASAAEIVAACLQDHNRAAVVGEQTFGRGTVQSLFPLNDGRAIKLTSAAWLRPNGRSLQRTEENDEWGVRPDPGLVVPLSDEERQRVDNLDERRLRGEAVDPDDDPQLKVAVAWLEHPLPR